MSTIDRPPRAGHRAGMDDAVPDRVLSRPAILEARKRGQVLIEPFDDRCVKRGSVDVRLGDWYYAEQCAPTGLSDDYVSQRDWWQHERVPTSKPYKRLEDGRTVNMVLTKSILNPYDERSVRAMWGKPQQAKPLGFPLPGIPDGTPVIVIPPGGVFLGHTHEFIGSLSGEITFMVKARSSIGRNRVRIAACAGWGDQGYANRIALELANESQYRHVVLVPGRRVGQIVFIPTTPLPAEEMYFTDGKYQSGSRAGKGFEELLAGWSPEEMLPKMHLDYEVADVS